jgi:hypothetical protein
MMRRFVDRGAIVAAYVGIGMAVTMAISFLLVIPIGPAYVLLSVPGGMIIGYYANARSTRLRGQWRRIVPNALLAGAVTGLTLAILLLGTKALFFYGDSGYPDFNRTDAGGIAVGETCVTGADCVYHRYVKAQPQDIANAGVTDAASFSTVYWNEQFSAARLLLGATTGAALLGGFLFGIAGPRRGTALPNVAAARA